MAEATQNPAEQPNAADAPKGRVNIGVVVSDKMNKTRVVLVQRLAPHPTYHKYVRRDKKLYVHDENNDAREGDRVEVIEISRPLSRLKRYTLVRVIERAK